MIDEKRIKRFIEGAKEAFRKVDNKTFTFPMTILSAYELATSIEELLKEHEAVEPYSHLTDDADLYFTCGKCGNVIWSEGYKYCPTCGLKVAWNGEGR